LKVIDLTAEHRKDFAVCLEDWSKEANEASARREEWVKRFLDRGLRAKLSIDDKGTVGGMIQYLPIEQSWVSGEGLYFIPCTWVHGYRKGRGKFQGKGMGSALLEAAEADARKLGAKGMAAWGIWLPLWMKASWYKKHGYLKADRRGLAVLLWKPFTSDAKPPKWYPDQNRPLEITYGKVTVTAFVNGWCTAANIVAERARKAASMFPDRAIYKEIDSSDRKTFEYWGYSQALFLNHDRMRIVPPPSVEKIREQIAKRLRRF
jgi:GNAT superfamily N-acetyltransferase